MNAIAAKALALWGMRGAECSLVAARENQVFRVDHGGQTTALRLHRVGYRTDAELRSELHWMQAVSDGGIRVPAPIAATSGGLLHEVQGVQVDMLTWLPGAPMGVPGQPLSLSDAPQVFRELGVQMARLHRISDAWPLPEGFQRCAWDGAGLLGDAPLWDRFWDNSDLSPQDRALFAEFRSAARADLQRREAHLDYGLIHADLVPANVMVDGPHVALIDFDDGGFGFRLFDIATTLQKHICTPAFPAMRHALLAGYRSVRPINTDAIDLFMALRAATYLGWNITRMQEDGARQRNARFIDDARARVLHYLGAMHRAP